MELKLNEIVSNADAFKSKNIALPSFDVAKMQADAKENPRWVHFGPGNIFRIFLARMADDMLADGEFWPITTAESFAVEEMKRQLWDHDLLTLSVILHPDNRRDLRVIAGIGEAIVCSEKFERLLEIFADPQMSTVTFTITEKGYAIRDAQGEFLPGVREGLAAPAIAAHSNAMVLLTGLLLHRYNEGAAPINLLSCDNLVDNGVTLRNTVLTIAKERLKNASVTNDFVEWLEDRTKVSFPVSVIDKITPRPTEPVSKYLSELGFSDMGLEVINRTEVAGFVNSEPVEYLILEDAFAAPRPPFEKYGAHVVDRETVDKFERMKVTGCLNPLHTALAIIGVLLGLETVDQGVTDPTVRALVDTLGYKEVMPVVADPKIVKPADFIDEVLNIRFANKALPDSLMRVATDTSQIISIRFGETVKEYIARDMDLDNLVAIPLFFASWCRYLLGIRDDGTPFDFAPDPLVDELHRHFADITLGSEFDVHQLLEPILSNSTMFGVDLSNTALAPRIEQYFWQMTRSTGVLRDIIEREFKD